MADLSIPACELSIVEDAVAAFAAPGPTLDANDRQRLAVLVCDQCVQSLYRALAKI